MYIITEDTPNPNVKKFIPGVPVMEAGTYEFKDKESAAISSLATRLFSLSNVTGLFYGSDFISVTIHDQEKWQDIRLDVIDMITENFLTHQPLFKEKINSDSIEYDSKDQITVDQILDLIETRVRPAVAQDGGDITFKSYKDGIVFVTLKGACAGCPSSTITLKNGIENMLKHYVPEIIGVEAV